MSKQDEGSYHIRSSIIGGIFALLAACIGGAFLIANTLIAKGFTISGPGLQVGDSPTQDYSTAIPTTVELPTTTFNSGFSESDIDNALGAGNWHCIDGFPNSVSIDNVPTNFVVQYPFTRVDKNDVFYYSGDTVPQGRYATGWLQSNLPNNDCSASQPEITQSDINSILGNANWSCLTQYPTGVKVKSVPSNFVVNSPVIFVDKNDVRYYKGETVPSGGAATVWFANEISGACP